MSLTHTSIQTYSLSQTSTISGTYSESLSPSFTPYASQSLSPSITAYTSQLPLPTVTAYPTPTKTCSLVSLPEIKSSILSSVSDNTFYAVITTIVILFLLNMLVSLHYYTEYTNEKIKKRVFDPVYQNPYHTNVREIFNRA